MQDLFKKPTQHEQVYEFIKQKGGRILTYQLNELAVDNRIGDPQTRAREMKRAKQIFRLRQDLHDVFFSKSKCDAYTIYEWEGVKDGETIS